MLGLGLSLTTGGVATPAYVVLAKAFVSRVEADGGTVDSFACLKTDMAYLTSNPDAPAGYTVEWSAATVGSSAEFRIYFTGGAGYTYTYAVTDTQATEVTGTGVMGGNIQAVTADLSTLVDGTVTLAVYLTGAGGDGNVVTDTANLVGYTGLLDTYSGAAAAYSLRLLNTSYTGDAVVVRRASDNTTQSIGFVNNELDTATLELFCSGTDGFVTTWYDQSGNGNDATQASASSQPQIVSGGSTILDGAKPTIDFDFVEYLTTIGTGVTYAQPNTYFIVASATGGSSDFIDSLSQSNRNLIDYGGGVLRMYAGNVFSSTFPFVSGQRELKYALFSSVNSELSVNGATNQTGNPSALGMDSEFMISDETSVIKMQELIMYNSNESANQTAISNNINDFYSIY